MSDDRTNDSMRAARQSGGIGPRYQPRSLLDKPGGPPAGGPPLAAPARPAPAASGGGKKDILCAIGVDVDAVAGWLGSYGGEDSPCDISRGLFSGEIGSPRMVRLFDKFGIRTTWFIPGHSIETFPKQMQMVVDAGHEIGMHGYSHENPIAMTPEQEEAVLDKCIELIEPRRRPPADRLCRAVVGVQPGHQRTAAQ